MPHQLDTVRQLLKGSREQLLGRANVVATGVGYKVTAGQKTPTLCITCSVTEKVRIAELPSRNRVPPSVDGIPTDVIQTGCIRIQQLPSNGLRPVPRPASVPIQQSPTERLRPAPGGVSIGHQDITAGTLGCLVRKDGQVFILSNNHVLANSNEATIGDPILQPGPHDGGRLPDDHIANLEAFVTISFIGGPSGCPIARGTANFLNTLARAVGSHARLRAISEQITDNLVDAALARPLKDADVSDQILGIGTIEGSASADLEMTVKKSGRTTGLTRGEIQQIDVTVNVQYGAGRIALFTDQLMAGPMSQGGDSGSAVLDDNNRLVGLLFAGSENSTIINRIENVFSALGVTL
jgi:hypothetical protein